MQEPERGSINKVAQGKSQIAPLPTDDHHLGHRVTGLIWPTSWGGCFGLKIEATPEEGLPVTAWLFGVRPTTLESPRKEVSMCTDHRRALPVRVTLTTELF